MRDWCQSDPGLVADDSSPPSTNPQAHTESFKISFASPFIIANKEISLRFTTLPFLQKAHLYKHNTPIHNMCFILFLLFFWRFNVDIVE